MAICTDTWRGNKSPYRPRAPLQAEPGKEKDWKQTDRRKEQGKTTQVTRGSGLRKERIREVGWGCGIFKIPALTKAEARTWDPGDPEGSQRKIAVSLRILLRVE